MNDVYIIRDKGKFGNTHEGAGNQNIYFAYRKQHDSNQNIRILLPNRKIHTFAFLYGTAGYTQFSK